MALSPNDGEGHGAAQRRAVQIFEDPVRHLALAVGAAIGLYSGALLWGAHQGWNAVAAMLAGVVGGLAVEYEASPVVQYAGYLFGLLSATLAVSATSLGVLAYGPWIALGGALFTTWPAVAGLAAADVLSLAFALTEGRSLSPSSLLAPAAALVFLHLG
ncbi:MAG: hypothetical protein E6H02_09805, partial [Bacillati bacterium ANGP1]